VKRVAVVLSTTRSSLLSLPFGILPCCFATTLPTAFPTPLVVRLSFIVLGVELVFWLFRASWVGNAGCIPQRCMNSTDVAACKQHNSPAALSVVALRLLLFGSDGVDDDECGRIW
jgi:hypothetical protein